MRTMTTMTPARRIAVACLLLTTAGCSSSGSMRPAAMPVDLTFDDVAEERREIRSFDPGGRIRGVRWHEDDGTVTFTRLGDAYTFDLETRKLKKGVDRDDDDDSGSNRERGRRGPGRGRQSAREESPDGKWVAVAKDWNVVIEGVETDQVIEVTTDGTRKLRNGRASWVYGEELNQRSAMWWSPDSSKLVFYEFDEREVPDHYLLSGLTDLHTGPLIEGYPKPGEANPQASLLVYDLESGETIRLETRGRGDERDEPWYVYQVRFSPDGSEVLFNRTNRHQNILHVEAADPVTGATRAVLTERQGTWQNNRPYLRFLEDQRRFIWETERNGVRQFEVRDLRGNTLAMLTPGPMPAISIARVDEETGYVYYTAYSESHPLDAQLFRVKLDGSDNQQLTHQAANHTGIQFSPDGKYFIACAEGVMRPPVTAIYSMGGSRLATLAASDPGRIAEFGYPEPELFTYTAEDGRTTLYGWLYKPKGFDPARRYPLLVDVYGGPGSKGVRDRWRAAHPDVASGFLVAKFDNRGTGGRGKAFLGAVYKKLGIVDIQDQADGARHLMHRPYVNRSRVGIYGHSYGGYLAALAILKYPDVFHVAVAASPVTDWRNYDTIYTERYMRTPEENPDGYDAGSCLTYAENLRGNLLILHGMIDDNVHPNNTWQLVDALQKDGKTFEIMFYPTSGHGLGRHSQRVRWEFLVKNLWG